MGFEIRKKNSSWLLFLVLNGFSVFILFLKDSKIIQFNNMLLAGLFERFLMIMLIISIGIPVVWRFFYDRLIIKLKDKYFISVNPSYKIRKSKTKNSQLLGIYMITNIIGSKLNKSKKTIHQKISEERWLPRKLKFPFFVSRVSPFLHFYEFSTPINFQKQFLNIILALQEWDTQYKNMY